MKTSRFFATVAAGVMAAAAVFTPVAGATTHAGDSILLKTSDDKTFGCTLTDIREDNNGRPWGVTAGHCFEEADVVSVKSAGDDQMLATDAELAELKTFYGENNQLLPPQVQDVAVFPLAPGVDYDSTTIHSYSHHRPILSELVKGNPFYDAWNSPWALGEPQAITPDLVGRTACQEGGSLGRTCGVIVYSDPDSSTVVAVVPTIQGDSGGPLHVAGPDGKRHVIGALSGGTVLLVNSFSDPSSFPLFG
ncbi:trypsin-like serine protease [Corynebacterium ciconiae]|uniref:trypsin-like serine protease n=1 Tax=Corynebacterium ciconiae TaxID=227319 RepID=UPI00039D13CE|nr:trypsin-like serine protease [Corynebacterium ciconiae]